MFCVLKLQNNRSWDYTDEKPVTLRPLISYLMFHEDQKYRTSLIVAVNRADKYRVNTILDT
jgi:hypothetical protein